MVPLFALLLSGCIVHYTGDPPVAVPEPLPPPVDFAEVESRLISLIESEPERDRRDRLSQAAQLAHTMRSAEPSSQRAVFNYLQQIVQIEERNIPVEAPVLMGVAESALVASFTMDSVQIEEEELESPELEAPGLEAPELKEPPQKLALAPSDGAEISATSSAPQDVLPDPLQPPTLDVDALLRSARALADAGAYDGAMGALSICRERACWDQVVAEWADTRDALVWEQREDAGQRFLDARSETDPVLRQDLLLKIREDLAQVVDRYPESRYTPALRRNIDLVQNELARAQDSKPSTAPQ